MDDGNKPGNCTNVCSFLDLRTEKYTDIRNNYWIEKCKSVPDYKILEPTLTESQRPLSSYDPVLVRELHLLIAEWHQDARHYVSQLSEAERCKALVLHGIQPYSKKHSPNELYIEQMKRRNRTQSNRSRRHGDSQDLSFDSSTSAASYSSVSCSSKVTKDGAISGHKRKGTHGSFASHRFAKYPRSNMWPKKGIHNSAKRSLSKLSSKYAKSKQANRKLIAKNLPAKSKANNQLAARSRNDGADEEEEEEEDPLTVIIRQQRKAFSARLAAGRPSARKTSLESAKLKSDCPLPAASRLPSKVLRAWKVLAKKVICKVARQRLTYKRDKIALAKRVARDCTRQLRPRALLSQKLGKDGLIRGHRLAREIALNWRNSVSSVSNGTGPLTVNGVAMPSCVPVHFSMLLDLPDYYGCESKDLGGSSANNTGASLFESAASVRRRAEKAVAEQRRADLELLEARRQQRKLNFLITQTELYAHFMATKMAGTNVTESANGDAKRMVEEEEEEEDVEAQRILKRLEECADDIPSVGGPNDGAVSSAVEGTGKSRAASLTIAVAAKAAATRLGIDLEDSYNIDNVKTEALMKVKTAVAKEQVRASEFRSLNPTSCTKVLPPFAESQNQAMNPDNAALETSSTNLLVQAPTLFRGQLKDYQLRGLNWLLSLFDQGINGILADEMGLGKTIQTIAFLGSLAEKYNIWGPFLIVSPASTLHNWSQEFAKFLPSFRLVPYWGSPSERKVLRRFWSTTSRSNCVRPSGPVRSRGSMDVEDEDDYDDDLEEDDDDDDDDDDEEMADGEQSVAGAAGTKQSQLHVVITSYQIVLQDAKFINKTSWSYIVLDEAHSIKNTSSLRWRILLSFNCRNRLLLTGTPIQNTMQELWALLHFIMPSLFDSHDEFANWFSRDIESQASVTAGFATSAGTGQLATSKLNENQLSRLHLILKPFMLRRTKAEVEHEISKKTEIMFYCPLSHRQQILYDRLRNKIRLEDLSSMMSSSSMSSEGPTSSTTAHLINLVMQLRKVCNHPDLLERREVRFPCSLGQIDLDCRKEGVHLRRTNNFWQFPRLFYDDDIFIECGWKHSAFTRQRPQGTNLPCWPFDSPTLGADKLACVGRLFCLFHPDHIHQDWWHHDAHEPDLSNPPSTDRGQLEVRPTPDKCFSFHRLLGLSVHEFVLASITQGLSLLLSDHHHPRSKCRISAYSQPPKLCLYKAHSLASCFHVPSIVSFAPGSRPFLPSHVANANMSRVLVKPLDVYVNHFNQPSVSCSLLHQSFLSPIPFVKNVELVSIETRLSDSGKLTALDNLLVQLKTEGHRVLVYSQMTRMIDILEEFMLYRKHAYLRLDGSSRLSDRRDMVAQWQNNPRLFVFLLSTRAGGLGINLTAADTVIFYDSDWNPTVDQQAMDRAHRLGQSKPVTVYRLICNNTVEGRMLRRAEEKRAMHHMVIESSQGGLGSLVQSVNRSSSDQLTSSEMVSLLLDDDELVKRLQIRRRLQPQRGRPAKNH